MHPQPAPLALVSGSRIGVIGGGPAGAFFAYFLLTMGRRAGRELAVDIHEPRDFTRPGPRGCNMCGGIISESLVQMLAAEGINLPPSVVQRGIDSYVLHMDVGSVRIATPAAERRIASIHRGGGPLGSVGFAWRSLDAHLLDLAERQGARVLRRRARRLATAGERPVIVADDGTATAYDLVAVAAGLNTAAGKLLATMPGRYRPPRATRTFICEYDLGRDAIRRSLGDSMHVFLLDLPRLEFAAVIPKGDHASVCMLGDDIDDALVDSFLDAPEVRACFPAGWDPAARACRCLPQMPVGPAREPFADRLVFLGDCGVSRLFKDGIGSAYRTAKTAAATAVFAGVAEADFRRHYWPACLAIVADNRLGKLTFAATGVIQRARPARRAVWNMVVREQRRSGSRRRLSLALWDLFTGSASYREVFMRMLHPLFLLNLVRNLFGTATPAESASARPVTGSGALGTVFADGEVIVRQGDVGECMYVIQEGEVEVSVLVDGRETVLRRLHAGELIGELALLDRQVRSATVKAVGEARVVTVDRATLLKRLHEDPSLVFHIVESMSHRIRQLSDEVCALQRATPGREDSVAG
ncbi:MAG: cyclic nucleotide-binding domain-containing protein [Candidatus Krumholzibacteriia bacterium]